MILTPRGSVRGRQAVNSGFGDATIFCMNARNRQQTHTIASAAWSCAAVAFLLAGCERPAERGSPAPPASAPASGPAISARPAAEPPLPAPPEIEWTETLKSADGTYVVRYHCEPHPIPLGDLFRMTVGVFAADGEKRVGDDVELRVDAAMPEHAHGMNTRPTVERGRDGLFRVDGMLFHMSGYWEIYFDVVDHGVVERAQTSVTLE